MENLENINKYFRETDLLYTLEWLQAPQAHTDWRRIIITYDNCLQEKDQENNIILALKIRNTLKNRDAEIFNQWVSGLESTPF